MIKLVLISLLMMALNACIASSAFTYVVYVDDKFDDVQRKEIEQSLQEWTDSSEGEVRFVVQFNNVSQSPEHSILIIYSDLSVTNDMCNDTHAVGCTYRDDLTDTSFAYMATSSIAPEKFRRAVEHEIGHALGIGHLPPGNIMSPVLSQQSEHATCNDINALYSNRGTPKKCK